MIDMESLVREVMTDQTEGLHLRPDAATTALRAAGRRRRRHQRLALSAGSGAALAVAGTGIAAATGALPWWTSDTEFVSSPFATAQDPAAIAGSQVRLAVPGPESTTFEIVTNTVTIAGRQETCTAVAVTDAQGGSQHLTTSCGRAGAAVAYAGGLDWQAPSGATYAVVTGPNPTPNAVTVSLKDSQGGSSSAEPVGGGYYLIYVPAKEFSPTSTLVFRDASGHVVGVLPLSGAQ